MPSEFVRTVAEQPYALKTTFTIDIKTFSHEIRLKLEKAYLCNQTKIFSDHACELYANDSSIVKSMYAPEG